MNVYKYYLWSQHYDIENNEIEQIIVNGIELKGKRILEVGCGTGRLTEKISKYASHVVALDPCKEAIDFCKKKYSDLTNVDFYITTLDTFDNENIYYDVVVFSWSMYLIQNKLETLQIAKKMLAPNGKLLILQASHGEYEEEVAKLYSSYSSLNSYESANQILKSMIFSVFGNASSSLLTCYFTFSSIDEVVNLSLFFIEDEEGMMPSCEKIQSFKDVLARKFCKSDGKVIMSDVVCMYIAENNLHIS